MPITARLSPENEDLGTLFSLIISGEPLPEIKYRRISACPGQPSWIVFDTESATKYPERTALQARKFVDEDYRGGQQLDLKLQFVTSDRLKEADILASLDMSWLDVRDTDRHHDDIRIEGWHITTVGRIGNSAIRMVILIPIAFIKPRT